MTDLAEEAQRLRNEHGMTTEEDCWPTLGFKDFLLMYCNLLSHLSVVDGDYRSKIKWRSQIVAQTIWGQIKYEAKRQLKLEVYEELDKKCKGGFYGWPWSGPQMEMSS